MPTSNAAKINQTNIERLEGKATVTNFPLDGMYTSWMTKAQKKYLEVLKQPENRDKKYEELSTLVGFKTFGPWYKAIKDERFIQLLENMGAQVRLYEDAYPNITKLDTLRIQKNGKSI